MKHNLRGGGGGGGEETHTHTPTHQTWDEINVYILLNVN